MPVWITGAAWLHQAHHAAATVARQRAVPLSCITGFRVIRGIVMRII